MSHVADSGVRFDDRAKEAFRKQFWLVTDFCGVEVLTYSVLSNHFHLTVRVPKTRPVSDAELLRRYQVLYPRTTRNQPVNIEAIRRQLESGSPEGQLWRQRQLAQMGDLSAYMKLLKQRFSTWYNRNHDRTGTLWTERFKSLLVESGARALETVAAYIDLNAVRAGLVNDPKEYRFCGYGEAVAGAEGARRGLMAVLGMSDWDQTQAAYRQMLFGSGAQPREHGAAMSAEAMARVVAEGGKLPLATVLRCRLRYFSDGAVLGGRTFVEAQLAAYKARTGKRRRSGPQPVPAFADWGELTTLRGLRRKVLG
jgi:REP element-mobilizing transposase RayT